MTVQSHTKLQYNQSGKKFQLIPSHHQVISLQKLSLTESNVYWTVHHCNS